MCEGYWSRILCYKERKTKAEHTMRHKMHVFPSRCRPLLLYTFALSECSHFIAHLFLSLAFGKVRAKIRKASFSFFRGRFWGQYLMAGKKKWALSCFGLISARNADVSQCAWDHYIWSLRMWSHLSLLLTSVASVLFVSWLVLVPVPWLIFSSTLCWSLGPAPQVERVWSHNSDTSVSSSRADGG